MAEKKVPMFDGKLFYNGKHLHMYLEKYYSGVHKVTYNKVVESIGKRLKSIDKFYRVQYELVSVSKKQSLKKWMNIGEGYEEIIALEIRKFDDFIIQYLALKNVATLYVYRTPKKDTMLAYKPAALRRMIERYDAKNADMIEKYIKERSKLIRNNHFEYHLEPSQIKQNIF